MKKILSLLMLTACILAACTSVDDTLKPSDDIYVSVLETQDTVRVIPGDTVHFHFMVSTNNGAITRIEFVSDESIIEGHPEKMTFSLIDTTMVLTANTEGYLSREVSSLIVDYPCYVKSNPAILGNTQQITFRATNKQGNRGENYIRFRGYNTKKYSTRVTLINNYSASGKSRFFSLPNYRAYTENSFLREDTVIDGAEEIKQNISLVFRYNSSGDYHMYSPANPELQTYLESIGITGYNAEEMNPSTFYRIEGVGGHQLNDSIANETDTTKKLALINRRKTLDTEWFDTVDDAYLEQLDFSQAADYIEVTGGFYAIRTDDGRHGIIWVSYPNVFDNPIPITIERGIYQAVSTE